MDGKNINNKWCKCFPLITECWKAGKWFNNDRNSQETRNRHFYSTDLSFVCSLRSLTPSLTRVGGLGSFLDLGFLGEPYWFLQQVLAAIQAVGLQMALRHSPGALPSHPDFTAWHSNEAGQKIQSYFWSPPSFQISIFPCLKNHNKQAFL